MKRKLLLILLLSIGITILAQNRINTETPVPGQWSKEKINKWYDDLPWLVGCNYYPANAINQIDMWQASSWDPKRIDLELGWAESIGMNTLRVYLHDLVWADDEEGLYQRMDEFLTICENHGIRPWFVFFDDCHHPNPKLGEQPLPVRGYHNSGWLNCPARELAERYSVGKATDEEKARLKGYVQRTMEHFKNDKRVLCWELYNEPGRGRGESGDMQSTNQKGVFGDQSKQLVYDSWVWAREVNPSQPITSTTAGSVGKTNIQINKINNDFHSVHSYGDWKVTTDRMAPYQDGRPIFLTEWLGRNNGSTVAEILPKLKENKIVAVNWGFVSGESGTIWHWSSRDGLSVGEERRKGNVVHPWEMMPEPELWFHDLFRIDGTPYNQEEIDLFRELTGAKPKDFSKQKKAYKKHNQSIFIKDGWIRDPYIYLADDGYYYLTGTTPEPNNQMNWNEPYNTGLDKQNQEIFGTPSIVGNTIRVWRSSDLFDWEYLGPKFKLDQGYWAEKQPEKFKTTPEADWRLWAPEVYKIDGKWTYVHTTPAPVKGGSNLAIAESENEFSFPMGDDAGKKHDPSLFQDDDGKWYLLWGNTWIAPIKDGFKGLAGQQKRIDPSNRKIGHEGATLRKIGDKYVHFGTAWSTDNMRKGSYNLYYCLSDEVMGDYGPRRFAGRFLGHGTPFQDKEGRWWCTAFYNGNVPPISRDGIQSKDLSETAQTINPQGVTIVPMEVKVLEDGDVFIRAKDPDYRNPGPDEAQQFEKVK